MPDDAWNRAHEAADAAGVELRPLTSVADAGSLADVMRATWGEGESLSRDVVVALAHSGNVPWGAFDPDGELAGYVLGWAAVDERDGLHAHSHMLATAPDHAGRGVGFALKLAQRADLLGRDITVVRWTFDPMLARNAHLNITKLGADCDRFHRDFYGEMDDSFNAGDRSDRLVVRWDLTRDPGPRETLAGQEAVEVEIPPAYLALRDEDPDAARGWRDRVADELDDGLARGFVVTGFDADREGGRPRYLLTPAALDATPGRADG